MSTDADNVIAVLRTGHDELTAFVGKLGPDDLTRTSAADEWTVAQVLSHLGSGAEIALGQLAAARDSTPEPGSDANPGIWARWDAMTPQEQAAAFPEANERLVSALEALDASQRAGLRVELGWMPAPVDVATAARLRLSEFAFHRWDVEATFDTGAQIMAPAVPELIDQVGGMASWLSKPESLNGKEYTLAVRLTDLDRTLGLQLGEQIAKTDAPETPDGTLTLTSESLIRLIFGRLKPPYGVDAVEITGPLSLDDLRRVFPGF
ncbi:maleylpyruvate isomerase N-terminal domain-containing protein [Catenuloplanes sp. NPDC051500]|uniref:maleylpyruvate isomerase N-terminal domain-containing protein n=1 Tax=Catenuloplanes sp. NPDC051500 TaxID=3363959 RepID=UPI003798C297